MTHYTHELAELRSETRRLTAEVSELRRQEAESRREIARLERALVDAIDNLSQLVSQFTSNQEMLLELAEIHGEELIARRVGHVDEDVPDRVE